jgi:hypothetical protein
MGYGESGGWDIESLEDGILRIKRMEYGESGGWYMENLEDGIWRVWRMRYGELAAESQE